MNSMTLEVFSGLKDSVELMPLLKQVPFLHYGSFDVLPGVCGHTDTLLMWHPFLSPSCPNKTERHRLAGVEVQPEFAQDVEA